MVVECKHFSFHFSRSWHISGSHYDSLICGVYRWINQKTFFQGNPFNPWQFLTLHFRHCRSSCYERLETNSMTGLRSSVSSSEIDSTVDITFCVNSDTLWRVLSLIMLDYFCLILTNGTKTTLTSSRDVLATEDPAWTLPQSKETSSAA